MRESAEEHMIVLFSCTLSTNAHVCVCVLPALLDCVPSQQRVENRVNGLLKVLNEDGVTRHYSLFYHIYITGMLN